jgi:NADH dehydrogenase FAD-containing subunit
LRGDHIGPHAFDAEAIFRDPRRAQRELFDHLLEHCRHRRPEFHFHDFGSLVSLGHLSAVGSLMGRLIGGSMVVQGLIARWMYTSLYKMHQVSILGWLRVAIDTVSRLVRQRLEPRVKLH